MNTGRDMNDFNEKWIKDIRSRMENHSEPLPADLWEKIDAEISTPKVVPMWKKWYSVAAAAAAVAIVSSLSVTLFNNYVDKDSVKLANDVKPSVVENIASVSGSSFKKEDSALANLTPVEVNKTSVFAEKSSFVRHPVSGHKEEKVIVVNETDKESLEEVVKSEAENLNAESSEFSVEQKSLKQKRIDMMRADREVQKRNASYLAMTDIKNTKKDGSNIQLGLLAGNTPYNSSTNFNGISRLSSRKIIPQTNDIVIGESTDGKVTYSQVLFNNRDKQTYTNVKHHMPISVGASVKWNINDDWGLESGLSYTYLFSELQSGANSYVQDKQKLHYIGIPLKLHRSIWGNKLFSFYASAGGMIEKCVSGEIETLCVDDTRGQSYESESVGTKPWQFSVSAALGAQVNFLKFMSLYVEPGMAYYFDDGSDLLTIRKDKPFNFNLQFGLRFNIGK